MIKVTSINENTFSVDLDGQITEVTPTLEKKTGKLWVKLPENEYNRTWVSVEKVLKLGEVIIDTIKEKRTLEKRTSGTRTSSWSKYLTDEEKEQLEQIKKEASKRAKREQIEAEIKRLQAQLED